MKHFSLLFLSSLLTYQLVTAFPSHASLAGLSARELEEIIPSLERRVIKPPPGPLTNTSAILVNDHLHPWKPAGKDDIRGPCPGLNTLASHGWLPRNGIASPSQIITAVQEGFNMGNDLALIVTYVAHLLDGNLVTDLLSIGGKTPKTGPNPPAPAIVGGLDTHGVFEGDTSMTRSDAFFGDNHSFNETLFDQFVDFSNKFGGGFYNLTVAQELRFQRIQQSIATNPQFSFTFPRYFTAFAESVFPLTFFTDGRHESPLQLDMTVARGFFQDSRMPADFFRSNVSWTLEKIGPGVGAVFSAHPIPPGGNVNNTVNTYTPDPNAANFSNLCKLYTDFVNVTVRGLYSDAKGVLLEALNKNLDFLFDAIKGQGSCVQVPPFV
ncbi:Cloroperoxidase [Pholiota conissans]|uniref:Cloroperoxidase n=1 Tax=Pholiota conissans TaxID=109636 RepID=A0A9P6D5K1_9AGAR|nr:Cloroperoxidase [Pholiota conissans]